jgi:hypothetical protein
MTTTTNQPTPQTGAAAAARFRTPNLYQFSGQGIHVTYVPTGAGGLSHFAY